MGRPSVSPLDLPTPQGQLARSLGTHMEIKLEYDCRVRRWLYGAGNPLAILKSNRKGRSLKGGRGGGGGRDGHEEGRQTTATAIREKMKKTTTEWGEKRGLNVNFRLRLILGMSKMPSRLRFLRLPKLQSRSFRAARATRSRSRDGSSVSLSQSKLRPIPYQRVTLTDQRTGPNRVARAQLETRGGDRERGGIGPKRSAFLVAR